MHKLGSLKADECSFYARLVTALNIVRSTPGLVHAKVCDGEGGTGIGPFFNTLSLPCTIPPTTHTPVHL